MMINRPALLSFLLVLALQTTLGSSVGVGVEANSKAVDNSNGSVFALYRMENVLKVPISPAKTAAEVALQAPLLAPSYIFDGMPNPYLPSALRITGMVRAFIEPNPPSPSDFWELAEKYEEKVRAYVCSLLEATATYFGSPQFNKVTSVMNDIVNATAAFRDNIQGALDDRRVTIEAFTEELENVFMGIVNDLKDIPRPDQAPGHAERAEMVNKVLNDTNRGLVELAERHGIEEGVVTAYLVDLERHVRALIVTVGDINEQHPQLLAGLAFSIAALLIPEAWILRPFLSVFGFGPAGPLKGSAAAWMQRAFWGATVEDGSWFSWLQAAGMGVLPRWAWLVTKLPLFAASLLATFLPCVIRR